MASIQTFYHDLARMAPEEALLVIAVASAAMFVGTILLIPLIVLRLPAEYFLRDETRVWMAGYHPALRGAGLVVKNIAGLIFLLAGIAMLVLPGQGLLTMVIGVSLLDFPGKRRVEHRLLTKPMVFQAMNLIRQKFGKPAFSSPEPGRGARGDRDRPNDGRNGARDAP